MVVTWDPLLLRISFSNHVISLVYMNICMYAYYMYAYMYMIVCICLYVYRYVCMCVCRGKSNGAGTAVQNH